MMEMRTEQYLLEAVYAVAEECGVELPPRRGRVLVAVMEALERLGPDVLGVPLGLLIARRLSLLAFGELGLAMRASEDLGDALGRLVRFHQVRSPFVEISQVSSQETGLTTLSLDYRLPQRACLPVIVEGGLAMLVHVGRAVCGVHWAPHCVQLPHVVRHKKSWEAFFRAPVYAGVRASLELTPEVLGLPTAAPDALVAEFLDASVQRKLEEQLELPLSLELQRWLMASVGEAPQVADAARAMRMSRRTLHRHLRGEGATFQGILDQVRKETAQRMLERGSSVGEIALFLGYADTSSFCRAYRRWTGCSPGKSR